MKRFLFNFMLFSVIVGCSTTEYAHEKKSLKPTKPSLSEQRKSLIQSRIDTEKNLEKLTQEAIETGGAAVSYLASDLFLKANDSSLNGQPETAILIYKHVVKLKPNDIFVRKKYAVELIKANLLVEAKDQLVFLTLAQDKELAQKAKLLLAGVYSALNQKEKAIKNYREIVLEKGPSVPEACVFLAKSYVGDKKFRRAFSVLDFCFKKSSDKEDRSSFAYYKAKIEFDRERPSKAVRHLRKSISLNDKNYQAILLLGHIYELGENQKGAKKLYKKFLDNNPTSYSVLSKYVNLLFTEGEYRSVIPYLERLLTLDEENLNLKVRLGVLYTEAGRIDEAKSVFKEILKVMPDSDKVLYYLGSLYQQTSDSEDAIEYFSRITQESALYHESNIQIAQILNALALNEKGSGKNTYSEKRFLSFINNKQTASDHLSVELNVVLAGYLETNKDFDGAIKIMEKVKGIDGFNDGHDYYLAALYDKVDDYKNAEKIVYSMLEKDPDNPHALNFIGYSLLERGGDMDKAYEYISKAVKLRPDDGYIRDSLGWYYYKNGQYAKAHKETLKAWSLVKDDMVITKHLALIYKAMNNYDKAKQYYVEALKNCKVIAEREEVVRELESLESVRMPASR